MATDVITGLKTVEEYVRNIVFSYMPVSNEINLKYKHDATTNVAVNFRRLDVDNDNIVAENLTAGQTEVAHIKAREQVKTFGKYLKGAKIIQSVLDFDFNRIPDVISKIIRQYSVIYDRQVLFGENSNAGIWNSTDSNAINNANVDITTTGDALNVANDIIGVIASLKRQVSDYTASRDVLVYVFGSTLNEQLDKIIYNGQSMWEVLRNTWREARFVSVPGLVTQGVEASGFSVVSQDLVVLNWTKIPELESMGYNTEDKYFWGNFQMGSTMVDVREKGALINQPITLNGAAALKVNASKPVEVVTTATTSTTSSKKAAE